VDWRSDRTLCRCVAGGEPTALATLYDRYATGLYRYLTSLLARHDDAEDALQDVFVAFAERGRDAASIRNVRAYLYAAARHRALSMLRRASGAETPLTEAEEAGATEPDASGDETVQAALQTLPFEQREAVVLKVYGGLTFREIASLTQVAPDTAASRYRYAVAKLKQSLGETYHA
jgi:RNA polymerase sigma-70 factor, ECF subfamily